ncbi:PEP-CTERM sorting domain-containing protein [Kiritimatiellota bacterium B12222]|nr:PEP-CTERM sorting domain-containing protein [Kiritimatiellota bacterium B12222]
MKHLAIIILIFTSAQLWADEVTVNWGNANPSVMVDSGGIALTSAYPTPAFSGDYTVALGTFDSFSPTETNYNDWQSHWRTFDQAPFNDAVGAFASEAFLESDGSSSSVNADNSASFFNSDAYIWIYNRQDAVANDSEWFLGRVSEWTFPTDLGGECCGNLTPTQWSLTSDFANASPSEIDVVWGAHSSGLYAGGGAYTVAPENFLVQTYLLIPEPSTWIMMALSFSALMFVGLFRRKGAMR